MIHPSHKLFMPSDFTDEEVERGNQLAVAVIEGGLSVCKVCGEFESGLETSCAYNQQSKKWARLDDEMRGGV